MNIISPNPRYELIPEESGFAVRVRNLENGFKFFIAKDSMGTQICLNGKFFPDSRDFGSILDAVLFLSKDDNIEKAEKFFRESPEPSLSESLFALMAGIFSAEIKNKK